MTIKLSDAWKIIETGINPTQDGLRADVSPNIGLLRLLASTENANASRFKLGNVQVVDQGDGKVYKVSRRFMPRKSETDDLSGAIYCPTAGEAVTPKTDVVDIKNFHRSHVVEIDNGVLRCLKENRQEFTDHNVLETLRVYLNILGQKVSKYVAQNKVGLFRSCDCSAGDASHPLPLYKADGQGINPAGEFTLERDRLEAELSDNFILIGGTILSNYRKYHDLQTGNDLGVDASRLMISNSIYYDTNFQTELGDANSVLAMPAGALQFISYAKNQGDFAEEFDDDMRTTYVDPIFGLTHDVNMSVQKCGDEIKRFIWFSINWDVVGMPECWSEDCRDAGVTDVYHYIVECSDLGACDIVPNCGNDRSSGEQVDPFCESATECEVSCSARFGTDCGEYTRHGGAGALTDTAVSAFRVNGGGDVALSQAYDLTDATDSANFLAELKIKLGMFGGVTLVSGRFDTAQTFLEIFTNVSVTSIELVDDTAGAVTLPDVTGNYIHVYSQSTPSTGATITDLSWVTPDTTAFNGAAGVSIGVVADFYGDYDEFFAETTENGTYQLTITDSAACGNTVNAASAVCP